jgi:hypothetical protein
MPNEPTPAHGVMEGKGSYNEHAKVPVSGAALALPLLENAVSKIALESSDLPLVIADYGSSQGKNSLGAMRLAITTFRKRATQNRSIFVFHVDQASNDFNTLFGVLHADPERYTLDDPDVFPAAIGRSFYENVLPPSSVHFGWCSYAAVWLSRIPALVPGHFMPFRSSSTVRSKFERQALQDWQMFLALRARELRPGGRLVVVLPGRADDGSSGFEHLMDQANEVLTDMVTAGAITDEERARMVLQAYPRRKSELMAPFADEGRFQDLVVERFEVSAVPDPAWNDYEQDRNKEALAKKQSLFFRSVFMPSLAAALDHVRAGDAEAVRIFGDRLQIGLTSRLESQPKAMHSLVQTIVLAKLS